MRNANGLLLCLIAGCNVGPGVSNDALTTIAWQDTYDGVHKFFVGDTCPSMTQALLPELGKSNTLVWNANRIFAPPAGYGLDAYGVKPYLFDSFYVPMDVDPGNFTANTCVTQPVPSCDPTPPVIITCSGEQQQVHCCPCDDALRQKVADWVSVGRGDWILYGCDSSGKITEVPSVFAELPLNLSLDISNPIVRAAQYDYAAANLGSGKIDALATDDVLLQNLDLRCAVWQKNPATGVNDQPAYRFAGKPGLGNDPAWTNAVLVWLNQAHARMQSLNTQRNLPVALVANLYEADPRNPSVATAIANVDGVLDEQGFSNSQNLLPADYDPLFDSDWTARVEMMETIQSQNKAYFGINQFNYSPISPVCGANAGGGPEEPSPAEREFAVASYLMGKEHAASLYETASADYGEIHPGPTENAYPEDSAALGRPCGSLYPSGDAWVRDMEHGVALVNPSHSAVTIQLEESMLTIGGQLVPAGDITLPANIPFYPDANNLPYPSANYPTSGGLSAGNVLTTTSLRCTRTDPLFDLATTPSLTIDNYSGYAIDRGTFDDVAGDDLLASDLGASQLHTKVLLGTQVVSGQHSGQFSGMALTLGALDPAHPARSSLILSKHNSNLWKGYTLLSRGDGTFHAPVAFSHNANYAHYQAISGGDYNGDGLADLLLVWSQPTRALTRILFAREPLNRPSVFRGPVGSSAPITIHDTSFRVDAAPTVGHFDAAHKKRSGLLFTHHDDQVWNAAVLLSNGTGQFATQFWSVNGNFSGFTEHQGDINGDGLTDLILEQHDANGWRVKVALSDGTGQFAPPFTWSQDRRDTFGAQYTFALQDINGDGRADLALRSHDAVAWRHFVAFSQGNGFERPMPWAWLGDASGVSEGFADLSGDGKIDAYLYALDASGWRLRRAISQSTP